MKAKTIQTAIKVSVLGAVLITCLVALGANAQFGGPSMFVGKFTLPYEVHWGKTVLPAGSYSIRMESHRSPAILRSASGKISAFVPTPIVSDSEKGDTRLTVMLRGNERRVQSVNLPELGELLIYEPLTKAEHEELAKAHQEQTLSITAARK
jgi:hypothetical protein